MKKILGLDLGTNSIGWALIENDFENKKGRIIKTGTRVIPMTQDKIDDFGKGNSISETAERTRYRSMRRLRERRLLRRERLTKIFKEMAWLSSKFNPEKDFVAYKANSDSDKNEFLFENSYNEMLSEFKKKHPQIKNIPKDWTVYYLRKKALKEPISKRELVWVLYQFNQKRGYYELRSENEEEQQNKKNKQEEFIKDIVTEIKETDTNGVYEVTLNNGIKAKTSKQSEKPYWLNKEMEFIITTTTLKNGQTKKTIRDPEQDDWNLRKKRTEKIIDSEEKHPGEYIIDILIENPSAKIRGQEVHTIDRKYYRNELMKILQKQKEFHEELTDSQLYEKCVNILYPNNKAHRNKLLSQDFTRLLTNDILFYQRPLRSKKSLIEGCKHEKRYYYENGSLQEVKVKAIPKSHPLFQEYRIWSLIHNLRIFKLEEVDEDGVIHKDDEKTNQLLTFNNKASLFEVFNDNAEISQKKLLQTLGLNDTEYRLNYEEGKKLPGNTTKASFLKIFKKANALKEGRKFLEESEKVEDLWHKLYSLERKEDLRSALENKDFGFPQQAIEAFINFPKFKKEYGALSKKALKKMLPFMRCGKFWNQEDIERKAYEFLEWKETMEYDNLTPKIKNQLDELEAMDEFQGLSVTLAEYVVYHQHSEDKEIKVYNSPDDIVLYDQHSLRNPVVEQVLNETLKVVKEIWKNYGKPDEIHVESARELKSSADKRKELSKRRDDNEKTNKRAKAMLWELQQDNPEINPYSQGQLELFKIYEEGALHSGYEIDDEIYRISRRGDPTASDINKYKLWLDQKYLSPYTGQPIPLSGIFSNEYEIEHVIPQSRFFDDSFNNKVISETAVNSLKDKQTAYEFIYNHGGETVTLGSGKQVKILSKKNYEYNCNRIFRHNRVKLKNLLSFDIPTSFIKRQLNDTRYIAREIQKALAPIVRKEGEKEARPKNYLPVVGAITDKLKDDWGMIQIWKNLLVPRFRRMNEITGTENYYSELNGVPKFGGYENGIKRLDHRHHALDAIVVAAITKEHVNYLNSIESNKENYSLIKRLKGANQYGHFNKKFLMPWPSFSKDVYNVLSQTIISFKQKNRLINKGSNKYYKWNGNKKALFDQQKKDDLWSIRQPLHGETVHGKITLRQYTGKKDISTILKDWQRIAEPEIRKRVGRLLKDFDNNIQKLKKYLKENPIVIDGEETTTARLYYYDDNFSATRFANEVDKSFNYKKIEKVSNSRIRDILRKHLDEYNGKSEEAFSPEGLAKMNQELNIPIKKVRLFEALGKKYRLGERGNKTSKYVEAAKGTNLYFIIFENITTGERVIRKDSTLGLKDTIEAKKAKISLDNVFLNPNSKDNEIQEIIANKENYVWFTLSPNDLVYVPEQENNDNIINLINSIDWKDLTDKEVSRIYRMEKASGSECYFIQHHVASLIKEYNQKNKVGEFGSQNKMETSWDGVRIKERCVKLIADRLGNVRPTFNYITP